MARLVVLLIVFLALCISDPYPYIALCFNQPYLSRDVALCFNKLAREYRVLCTFVCKSCLLFIATIGFHCVFIAKRSQLWLQLKSVCHSTRSRPCAAETRLLYLIFDRCTVSNCYIEEPNELSD